MDVKKLTFLKTDDERRETEEKRTQLLRTYPAFVARTVAQYKRYKEEDETQNARGQVEGRLHDFTRNLEQHIVWLSNLIKTHGQKPKRRYKNQFKKWCTWICVRFKEQFRKDCGDLISQVKLSEKTESQIRQMVMDGIDKARSDVVESFTDKAFETMREAWAAQQKAHSIWERWWMKWLKWLILPIVIGVTVGLLVWWITESLK